jgi:GT2 family glycosyltransferase
LLKATQPGTFDLLVVDDGVLTDSFEYLSSLNINVIRTNGNVGVARARNLAIKESINSFNPDVICFLHDDMLFPTGWLRDSMDVLSSLQHNSVLGIANILDPDCLSLTQQEIDKISAGCRDNKICFANLEPRFYPVELFNEIGLLDESYQQSEAEDVDFNIRIKSNGYNLTATNLVNVFHLLGYTRLKLYDNNRIRQANYNKAVEKFGAEKFKDFNRAERKICFVDGMPYTLYGC